MDKCAIFYQTHGIDPEKYPPEDFKNVKLEYYRNHEDQEKFNMNLVMLYNKLGIDPTRLSPQYLAEGIIVEYEHGKSQAKYMNEKWKQEGKSVSHDMECLAKHADEKTNITGLDRDEIDPIAFEKTAKIALGHFAEGRNYYRYLAQMEHRLEREREGPFYNVFYHDEHPAKGILGAGLGAGVGATVGGVPGAIVGGILGEAVEEGLEKKSISEVASALRGY